MASKKDKKKNKEEPHQIGPAAPKQLDHYEVFESIGKGAFGVVYRAVNTKTGETVAIKTFSSATLPHEELRSIEGEVGLMQKLKHPNIVKYIDTVRTPETLNIIIEFVEKGSLSGLRKKNGGPFPESVIALYTAQVLEGLNYLHEQGVVHRDIKGANILLAKDNVIKLADFGVATQLDPSQKELSVVGTPYWMAPEVIEMSGGASTACDIWSLGCTVIELIQGEPPYFNLDPMPALFRIVQDDHPPLPPGISQVLEEFLLCCFQKEPGLRAKASSLLKHRWISLNAIKPIEEVEKEIMKDVHIEMKDTIIGTVKIAAETMRMAAALEEKKAPQPSLPLNLPSTAANGIKPVKPKENFPEDIDFPDISEPDEKEVPPPKIDLNKFREDDNDDEAPMMEKFKINALNKMKLLDKVPDKPSAVDKDDDPFEAMGVDDNELQVDLDQKLQDEIGRCLIDLIPNSTPSGEVAALKAIEQLKTTFSDPRNLHHIVKMTSKHGVLPFLEMLGTQKEELLLATLRLVYDMVKQSYTFLQSLCLMGLIPAIDKFVRNFGYNVKMEAGKFLKLFCGDHKDSDIDDKNAIKRIFIASGGLQSVVALINQKDYATYKSLIHFGVDCVELVLKETSASIKSDLCRLFCKAKIIKPMVDAMIKLQDDDANETKAQEYVKRIVDLFYTFCQTGKSSARAFLARKGCLRGLRDMLLNPKTAQIVKVNLLRIIQLLANEVSARDNLQQIQLIPILVNLLDSDKPDIVAQVLPTIVFMFQVNPRRQEEMALNGIIPILQKFIQMNHHAKQIPLDLICHLSQNKVARVELKKYGGIEFYLELLEMPYWRKRALQALATWIVDDGVRVEAVLMQNHNLHRLITSFHEADKNDFNDFSKFLERIVTSSVRVNRALGKSGKFLDHLVSKLTDYKNDNIVLRTLLAILKSMLEQSETPKTMGKKKLDDVLTLLSNGSAVLVADAASQCMRLRQESKKSPMSQ